MKDWGKRGEKRQKVLVFGNAMVGIDSLPLRLMPELEAEFPNIEFKEFDPNENLEKEGRNLNIIDTVVRIRKVTLITDIDAIETSRPYSMHDFDLGHNLKLLKKIGYLDSVRIFGVPMKMDGKKALDQLIEAISATLH